MNSLWPYFRVPQSTSVISERAEYDRNRLVVAAAAILRKTCGNGGLEILTVVRELGFLGKESFFLIIP